jgi:hypothetical protein
VNKQRPTIHTLHEVNVELIKASNEMDRVTEALIEADEEATELRAQCDFADIAAFLGAEGQPMEMRKYLAKDAVRKAGDWEARVAEAKVRRARARLRAIEKRLDTMQWVGSNIKSEAKVVGNGYGAGS